MQEFSIEKQYRYIINNIETMHEAELGRRLKELDLSIIAKYARDKFNDKRSVDEIKEVIRDLI